MNLTKDKFKCTCCGKTKYLVIVRHRAWLCKVCYEKMLNERREKRKAIRGINQILCGEIK